MRRNFSIIPANNNKSSNPVCPLWTNSTKEENNLMDPTKKGNALSYQKITRRPPPRRKKGSLDCSMVLVQSIIDAIPIPLFCKNLDNEFVAANAAFERLTGVAAYDLLSTSGTKCVSEVLAAYVDAHEHIAIADARRVSYVLTTPGRNGILMLSVQTVPLVDPNGTLAGTLGMVTGVSATKKRPRYSRIEG